MVEYHIMTYGNTVGSQREKTITWSKEIRDLQKQLVLTPLQKDVLIGTILGDGCLIPNVYKKNYRLKIEHSDKQKHYLEWKYQIFRNWCLQGPIFQPKTNSWVFRTISHPKLTWLSRLFYKDRKKIIPATIVNFLKNPLTLAVWFMDDGGLDSHRKTVTISTHSFSKEENKRLINCLSINFGLKVNLNWDGKGFRLYVPVKSIKDFVKIVYPYILPTMKYKLPLDPVETRQRLV